MENYQATSTGEGRGKSNYYRRVYYPRAKRDMRRAEHGEKEKIYMKKAIYFLLYNPTACVGVALIRLTMLPVSFLLFSVFALVTEVSDLERKKKADLFLFNLSVA